MFHHKGKDVEGKMKITLLVLLFLTAILIGGYCMGVASAQDSNSDSTSVALSGSGGHMRFAEW